MSQSCVETADTRDNENECAECLLSLQLLEQLQKIVCRAENNGIEGSFRKYVKTSCFENESAADV